MTELSCNKQVRCFADVPKREGAWVSQWVNRWSAPSGPGSMPVGNGNLSNIKGFHNIKSFIISFRRLDTTEIFVEKDVKSEV